MDLSYLADNNAPPVLGEVASIAVTTSQAVGDLESSVSPLVGKASTRFFYDKYVTFQADGCDCYIAFFNTNAGTIAPAQTPAIPGTQACVCIPNGQSMSFLMPPKTAGLRYVYVIAASGSGKLRFWASSPPAGLGGA